MIILGIETSCDETAAAIVKDGRHILANVVASSASLHAKYGGIIPEIAAREQLKSLLPVLQETFFQAAPFTGHLPSAISQINAIAVTVGPGLIGPLLIGIETAKTISHLHQLPLIPVNHLVGHIYANWLIPTNPPPDFTSPNPPQFPVLALVVSGGHTDLVFMKNHQHISLIGSTRDDAAGETFDKTARLLNLPYPGGPHLSQLAKSGQPSYPLPRPLTDNSTFDWSFSGLKTAVSRLVEQNKHLDSANLASSIECAIIDSLVSKTIQAAKQLHPRSLLLAGGVSANSHLRQTFKQTVASLPASVNPQLFIPSPSFCTDNAAYIAAAAYFHYTPKHPFQLYAEPSFCITDHFHSEKIESQSPKQ